MDNTDRAETVHSWLTKQKSHEIFRFHGIFWCDGRDSNRAAAHSAASKATVRLCLACGSQRLGMSTVEAVDRKISWLFCFVSHGCTVSARWEPRCNTHDFAGKVVCQRAFRRSLDSSRQGTGKWGALCNTRRIRHLAQKIDHRFYLTIRKICTIITMR